MCAGFRNPVVKGAEDVGEIVGAFACVGAVRQIAKHAAAGGPIEADAEAEAVIAAEDGRANFFVAFGGVLPACSVPRPSAGMVNRWLILRIFDVSQRFRWGSVNHLRLPKSNEDCTGAVMAEDRTARPVSGEIMTGMTANGVRSKSS